VLIIEEQLDRLHEIVVDQIGKIESVAHEVFSEVVDAHILWLTLKVWYGGG
jgi:hypothetical protein